MSQTIFKGTVVSIAPHLRYAIPDDTSVIMDIESGEYFGLDRLGTRIWQLIEEGGTIVEIIETLLCEYQVEQEHLKVDLLIFLSECRRRGWVTFHEVESVDVLGHIG
jgi:hypothetical protein